MGLIEFVKAAGRKIGIGDDEEDKKTEAAAAQRARQAEANARKAAAARAESDAKIEATADRVDQLNRQKDIMDFVKKFDFDVKNFGLQLNDDIAVVTGEAATQIDREKAVLVVGNHEGIATVDDRMTVADPAEESKFHTVAKGDTLSKIAKSYYGDAMKYPEIFDANRPMLKDPDLIYPGQVLRIPALD
ncbi:MAG: peptidoglycan-binding protein LysM [Acidimicrobiia bacterium]|nr:peptidoglycan-binding protein LysM [Acidimicrobiia bacterium]NNL46749.1 peptidoglycan-binding protein LysM [Acidimicrobiia bacterium]